MKNLIAVFVFICPLIVNGENIRVTLDLSDSSHEKQLFYKIGEKTDSTDLVDGKATFLVPAANAEPYTLSLYSKNRKFSYPLFIEGQDISLSGSFLQPKSLKCVGSTTQQHFLEYLSIIEPLQEDYTKKIKDRRSDLADSIKREILQTQRRFTEKYPESFISSALPYFAFKNRDLTANQAIAWLNMMDKYQPLIVRKHIDSIKETTILKDGDRAPDFSLTDVIGNKTHELKDHKGKIIVLAFWATWCGPCIGEIPQIKRFIDVNQSNPEIVFLSVSIDTSRDDLMKAIEKYNITYPVLADFDPNSPIIKNYGIGPLPVTYIVDKQGLIRELEYFTASKLQMEFDKSK